MAREHQLTAEQQATEDRLLRLETAVAQLGFTQYAVAGPQGVARRWPELAQLMAEHNDRLRASIKQPAGGSQCV